ncbi:MAG: succinate dehydrogenase assembly factor 2 [Alphaproteobacteria bacterium]|nr:MAG: succinate dehydrogenase assembly factor 2 [Alphaproteobacteria bacterium]
MNINTIAQDNMQDNTLENTRKKLIFRSWHRGTREIDLLLGRFADAHLPGFDAGELQQYEELLVNSDPDLYNWITGKETPPANVNGDVLQKLINFHS